jgi:glycosyltransferase involved in cell wall biosynthesis
MSVQEKKQHVTVALCVYNGEKTIEKSVWSLLHQTHKNVDIYVVDDASTDKTKDIVESILKVDKRLHLISLEENIGTYACKNLVLKNYCSGSYFAHQDADDYSWPERLEKQLTFLEQNPHVAACGVAIDEFYKESSDAPQIPSEYETFYREEDEYYHRKNLYTPYLSKGSCFHDSIEELSKLKIAMNGSIVFRSEILKDLGGFDGRTRVAGDTDLLWRLLVRHNFANMEEVLYSRRFHSESLTKSKDVGFKSNYRIRYMSNAFESLMQVKVDYELGNEVGLVGKIKQDMFVPDVNLHIYESACAAN